jgi:hypothetical protein
MIHENLLLVQLVKKCPACELSGSYGVDYEDYSLLG